MKIKISILFISYLICFFFVSCGRGSNKSQSLNLLYPEVSLDHEQKEPILLSKIFPEHRLIELETNEDCLIGDRGTKIIKHDSLFYIKATNEILVFDSNGKYLKKLSAFGAGPEEYTSIRDFDIVDDHNEIWICSDTRSLSKYDLNTFDFKGKLTFDFGLFTIKYIGDDLLITSTGGDDSAVFKLINSSGEIIDSMYENDMANVSSSIVDFYYSPSNKKAIHPLQFSNDAICYDFDEKKLELAKLIDTDQNILTAADNLSVMQEKGYLEQMRYIFDNFIQIIQIAEVNESVIMILCYPGNKWKALISKGGKSVVIPYFPADEAMVQNDIVENAQPMMLNTLVCGDSDDSFLFLAEIEDSENNPSILEVTKVAIP